MSLRLICGRAGTGKSNFCLEEIKERIKENKKIYIITPEQYSFTAEQKLLEKLDQGSVLKAEVLTFARMAYRVANEVGGAIKTNLSKSGKSMLIYDILEKQKKNLTFLGKSNQNIDLVDTQLTELKKHQISLNNLKDVSEKIEDTYLKKKIEDITIIYEQYEKYLSGKYIEENDRLQILANQLEKTDLYKDAVFYIDEFTGFTKQEYEIIEKLLNIASQINITITTDNLDMGSLEQDLYYSNKQTADKLLYLARKQGIPCEKTVFLTIPYRFKNKELKHLEENIQKIPYKKYNDKVENISIFLAKNPYEEVESVAKQIIKLVKENNYRYHDIIVITKELEVYSSLCKAIFAEFGIPVFIDEKKQLNQNTFAKYIISLLEIYSSNWSYESVISYLKSGFNDIEEDEIYEFENYTKKWGLKGSKWYKEEWDFKQDNDKDKEQLEKMKKIIQLYLKPLVLLKEQFNKSKTIESMNKALYEFLVENDIENKIKIKQKELEDKGKIELAKEQELAWNIFIQILDEINSLFSGNKTNFTYYRELLKVALGQNILGKIPQTQDQIILGDIDRTKSHKVKAIFVLGVNDGSFPTIRKQEGFLNDKDRETLKRKNVELAKGTLENLYEDNFAIYKAFTTAEEKLYFSYSSSNSEGGALRPSIYISKIKKIFPMLKEKSSVKEGTFEIINKENTFEELIKNIRKKKDGEEIDATWDLIFEYYKNNEKWKQKLQSTMNALNNKKEEISKENIEKLYGSKLEVSISKLEKYRSCPFSYYLKYGLKLKNEEEYKMKSIDTGTFMHEVIDDFFHMLREKNIEINELDEEQINKITEEIIDEKLELSKYYIFTSSDKFKILTNKLKRVIFKSMKYLIQGLKNSDFKVTANEVEFKKGKEYNPIVLDLEDGKKVEITGKIDRVDMAKTNDGNYIRIIDYKSSVKNIDLNEVIAGLQIQLLTYLDATCKIEEVMPAGVLYYSLIDPILKLDKPISKENIEEVMKKKFKMNGLILADVKVVKMMDKTFDSGSSSIIPVYLDKQGEISQSKSSVVSKEQFSDLMKYTNKIIKQIAKEILSGNIEEKPYYEKKNKKIACEYCEYKGICTFKENCMNYNYIDNNKKEVVLEKIREDIKKNEGFI